MTGGRLTYAFFGAFAGGFAGWGAHAQFGGTSDPVAWIVVGALLGIIFALAAPNLFDLLTFLS